MLALDVVMRVREVACRAGGPINNATTTAASAANANTRIERRVQIPARLPPLLSIASAGSQTATIRAHHRDQQALHQQLLIRRVRVAPLPAE
jgi:hypothetical protein